MAIKTFSRTLAVAVALFAACAATPAMAQVVPTVLQTATSKDGLLTVTLSSTNPTDAVDVNNTYTWTATNNSTTTPLTGVILGSHWGDHCPGATAPSFDGCSAPPTGPTLISLAPGCGGQSLGDIPATIAVFGVWCTPSTGVRLAPGASISGSVTLRPGTGGPAYYGVYSRHDPVVPVFPPQLTAPPDPFINYHGVVAPAATDIQISGAASTGSPSVGSDFTYTYQIKNAGPWGTDGGIIFTDTLPASLTYFSSTVVQTQIVDKSTGQTAQATVANACSVVGQNVVCSLLDLTSSGLANQATITLTVTAPNTAQPISNTATVHTNPVVGQTDLNLANNSVTVNVAAK